MDGGGGAPHPLSRFPPLRRPITKQEPAPGAASRGPATPKRRVFAGKKIRAAGSAAGSGGGPGAPGRRQVRAGSGATHASLLPSPAGPGAQAGEWIGAAGEVSLRTDRTAIPGRGKGPAHQAGRLCKTFGSGPETRGQHQRTRAPQRGYPPRRLGLCLRPGGPRESSPAARAPGGAGGTYPEPRGGRAGWVGEGLASRRGGCQAPRLRAGRPRFNCRARARFRAPLVPRARLGQWGAGGAGQPGAVEPMS